VRLADLRGPCAGLLVAALAALAVPLLLPPYFVFLATTAVIGAVALQSLGIVTGRAGMLSLCQMSFAAVGAWTVGWLNLRDAPGSFLLWLLAGGLASVPLGVVIGLPALRVRGINLAVVTLGFATCLDVLLAATTFPGQDRYVTVVRPPAFDSDQRYFALCVGVFALVGLGLHGLARTRVGSSWRALRHSERATAALGVSVTTSKLAAFALSAFIAGVSGGLLAGQLGTVIAGNFDVVQSMVLFAVAIMAGAQNPEGAVLGGFLIAFFPELLRRLGLSQDLGSVVFAVGATQALSAGLSQSEALRRFLRRRLGRPARWEREAAPALEAPARPSRPGRPEVPALEVRDLAVHFGSVAALDGVSLSLPAGAVAGLVGPNGAGKSTLIDVATGFVPAYRGSVVLAGRRLEGMSTHQRARVGIRRTFQQTRIALDLTVGQYVRLAAGRRVGTAELEDLLAWLDCPPPEVPVEGIDARARRLLDVAGAIVARPRAVLLDEPAAGLTQEESMALAGRIAEVPDRFGCAVLLIEHDIEVVRAACATATVLDFGRVIASGPTAAVLADEAVARAYLGVEGEELVS
jgi:branched-chain amino acid transport system permease protein